MKGFLKFVLTVSALFAAAVGVLVLADRIINKNRIRGAYLECDTEEYFAAHIAEIEITEDPPEPVSVPLKAFCFRGALQSGGLFVY